MATRSKTRSKPISEVTTRTLLVESHKDKFKITIPADWKVTFGAFQQGQYGENGAALRIYESENKQRACFVNVRSFRDLSIPVVRLVKQQNGESSWENDGEGNTSEKRKVTTKTVEVEG